MDCATMKLIVMTKSTYFVEEDKILASLFDEGMEKLHLCKPGTPPMYAERLLSLLSEDYHKKIYVHDHYYLKNEYGLGGIHLESADAPLPNGYKGHFSRTCGNPDELKAAKKKAEYVFLKNVFADDAATDAETPLLPETLKLAARKGLIDRHVYALGGINTETIRMAKDLGFGGVVVCEDLWQRFDIHSEQDYKALIEHFVKLRKVVG